jgi:hypothetical protein
MGLMVFMFWMRSTGLGGRGGLIRFKRYTESLLQFSVYRFQGIRLGLMVERNFEMSGRP